MSKIFATTLGAGVLLLCTNLAHGADFRYKMFSPQVRAASTSTPPGGSSSGGAAPATPTYTEITSGIQTTTVGPMYNRVTTKYSIQATFTNTTATTMKGPFNFEMLDFAPTITVDNASGYHNGNPYMTFAGDIAPGGQVVLTPVLSNPNKVGINWNLRFYLGTF